jgi:3-phosphoshikimate 1-carboxyvinyltransferase
MNLTVQPVGNVRGDIRVPGDKSTSHRGAIFGAIAHGTTRVHGFLRAEDTLGTLQALRQLGARIEEHNGTIEVHGTGFDGLQPPQAALDFGNSGTTARLMLGVLAGQPFESQVVGDASLSKRPMDRVQMPLQQMGAVVEGEGERCTMPLRVRGGNLHSIEYSLPVASAQVKSAILLAVCAEGTTRHWPEPAATRDHTERMLRAMGVEVRTDGRASVSAGGGHTQAIDIQVPGDISSAAFFLVAAALRPGWEITIGAVNTQPRRAPEFSMCCAPSVPRLFE